MVNITKRIYICQSFNEHINLHFDDEQDIHKSSKHYEKSGNILNLDLLIILY